MMPASVPAPVPPVDSGSLSRAPPSSLLVEGLVQPGAGSSGGCGDPPSVSLHRRLSSRGAFNESCRVSGHWTGLWASRHILELQAVVLALRQFLPRWHRYHVIIRTDSTVAAAYVNRMGG